MTQVAAAFVTVQSAFNWLVDNYARLADWASSSNRVSSLIVSLEQFDRRGKQRDNSPGWVRCINSGCKVYH